MIKLFVGIGLVILLGIALIGAYLSPDDLVQCPERPNRTDSQCQPVDAIVAISGGKTSLRAAEAIKLYKQGWAKLLVFSGAAIDEDSPSNAQIMRQQAINDGVPASAIRIDESARTTRQNAEKTKLLLVKLNPSRLIVVTSPYHQRRASIDFSNVFGKNVTVLNHPVQNDPDWPVLWWVTLRGWWLGGGELLKIAFTHAGES